jgi:hypothetical protein
MYLALACIVLGALGAGIYAFGPRYAIGATTLLALLIPTWMQTALFELPFDMRMVAAIASLFVVLIFRQTFFATGLLPWGIHWGDAAVVAIVAVQCLSDWSAGGNPLGVGLRAYGEWCIPYFVGRFCVSSLDDVKALTRIAVVVAAIISALAVCESISHVNPFEALFGERPPDLTPPVDLRFGIKRAFGPVKHPIYLGVLQLLLLPWLIAEASTAGSKRLPYWKWLWLALSFAGICSTASRGPLLFVVLAYGVIVFVIFQRVRTFLIAIAVCLVVGGALFHSQLFDLFIRLSKESRDQTYRSVVIDGRRLPFSSTMSRIYAFQLYRPALAQTGPLGFGTERVTGFPVDIPLKPENREALELMPTIENAYLLTTLRLGWLGLIAFAAATLFFAAAPIAPLAGEKSAAEFMFLASMIGVMVAMLLVLQTVWMPHDFGFVYLWTGGILSSLFAEHRARQRQSPPGSSAALRGRVHGPPA